MRLMEYLVSERCSYGVIVIAPLIAPQTGAPLLGGVQHPLAPEVMAAVRPHGLTPVGLWRVINGLANARNPDYRARRRCWRLRYWGACRELLRAKLLFRHGPLIALSDFATRPRPGRRDRGTSQRSEGELRLSPAVAKSTSKTVGSKPVLPGAGTTANLGQPAADELVVEPRPLATCAPQTQSATPAAGEISAAASALGKRSRSPKIWSGYIGDKRAFRNMPILLPNRRQAWVFFARHQRVMFTGEPDGPIGPVDGVGTSWGMVAASAVQIIKNEHAVLLGRLKAGTVERRSELKIVTARANGRMPARRGPRGRPRTKWIA
jgi:hypothetical protein